MRRVCVVGFAPETRELANAEPPDVELWPMNVAHTFLERWDRWYQMHPRTWREDEGKAAPDTYGRGPEHVEFLATCAVPVYMQQPDERIPTSVRYPFEEVWQDVCRNVSVHEPYFTSTVAYAVAQAIHEGVDSIKLVGINLSSTEEFVQQRACVEFLLGVAAGRGIQVELPSTTMLLSGPLYPRRSEDTLLEITQKRLDGHRTRYYAAWSHWYLMAGAAREAENWHDHLNDEYLKQVAHTRTVALCQRLNDIAEEANRAVGAFNEAQAWLARAGGVDLHAGAMPHIVLPRLVDVHRPTEIDDEKSPAPEG